jgi:raffinose/stachyose/melibiose transport system permease protein
VWEAIISYTILIIASAVVIFPLLLVLMNSFKSRNYISTTPFAFLTAENFAGFTNYKTGIEQSDFGKALLNSFFVTICSTILIILFTSMAAWFLTRVKTWWTKVIYYVIIFSMIVPFQMVMLPLSGVADDLYLTNIFGILIIYIGFGAGLSTFMYAGFVKSVPQDLEEAAMIDGCNPPQIFFKIVFPVLKPTTITISILNVMWIWNDYLLPYMVLGNKKGQTTVPVAIQSAMAGSYGDINYGAFMAMIVLTIIPIIIFYLFSQKYIIKGVVAGAVKG